MDDFSSIIFILSAIGFSIISSLVKKKQESTKEVPFDSTEEEEEMLFETTEEEEENMVSTMTDYTPQPTPQPTICKATEKSEHQSFIRSTTTLTPKKEPVAPPLDNTPHNEESDFAIHSAEEARKAIIWGEIMQRKYN